MRSVGCGIADPARAEHEPHLALLVARVDGRRRPAVVGRPDELAVEPHVVGHDGRRLEIVDEDERVVVTLDRERRRPMAEHLDLAGGVVSTQKVALSVPV